MMQIFDGVNVIDGRGDKIGTVERSYDDAHGMTRFVKVSMGMLFSREHRLIPIDDAQFGDEGLRVPFGKQAIEGSPDAGSADDTLQGALLERVREYYRRQRGGTAPGTAGGDQQVAAVPADEAKQPASESSLDSGPEIGAVRDLGDVIEVPIVEEELVKRPVVKEVLRIRKTQVSEPRTVEADVRKEDVEVVRDGEAVIRDNTDNAS